MLLRLLMCTLLFACAPARAQADALPRLLAWLSGEWNNNEQVWQQKIAAEDPKVLIKEAPVEHQHHIFAPVAAPLLGPHIVYMQQSRGDDLGKVTRQRIYRFTPTDSAPRVDIFRIRDEASYVDAQRKPELLAALKPEALEVTAEKLDAREDTNGPAGPPIKSRKVRYFEGWVWIKHAGPQAALPTNTEDKTTSFTKRIQIHTEGQRVPVMYEDGSASPYLLELAQLTYQNTRQPILKFALLDRASGKSVVYIWANTDATRIGMNLGWFQSGLVQKSERVHFGF